MPNFCDIVNKAYISNYQSFCIPRNSLEAATFGAELRRTVTRKKRVSPASVHELTVAVQQAVTHHRIPYCVIPATGLRKGGPYSWIMNLGPK